MRRSHTSLSDAGEGHHPVITWRIDSRLRELGGFAGDESRADGFAGGTGRRIRLLRNLRALPTGVLRSCPGRAGHAGVLHVLAGKAFGLARLSGSLLTGAAGHAGVLHVLTRETFGT